MNLLYAEGSRILGNDQSGFDEAIRVARKADVAILALGERGDRTGEAASRAHLDLDGQQQKLLEAIHATGKPVDRGAVQRAPADHRVGGRARGRDRGGLVPRRGGGPALVRMLFGDVNPSGRLTATWPRAVGQEPLYYNALSTGRPTPPAQEAERSNVLRRLPVHQPLHRRAQHAAVSFRLWPLVHDLRLLGDRGPARRISAAAVNKPGTAAVKVSASVTNSGKREGTEVVQCYIRLTGTSVARPVSELKGFQRVRLAPGETRQVDFTLSKEELSFWNIQMKEVVEPPPSRSGSRRTPPGELRCP